MKNICVSVLVISLGLAVLSCAEPPNAPEDFIRASGLCIDTLSADEFGASKFTDAGWEDDTSTAAGSNSANRLFQRGSLSLNLSSAGTARCFVDGAPGEVGSLAEVTKTLSRTLGPSTKENEGTYRWRIRDQGLLVKLSQTNTESEEVLRLYVFRPNARMIEGLGS